MSNTKKLGMGKRGAAVVTGLALVSAGMAGSVALADNAQEQQGQPEQGVVDQQGTQATASNLVQADKVEGTFSFTQGSVTPTSQIKTAFADAGTYLCGSQYSATALSGEDASEADPMEWAIQVGGDVQNAFTATIGEMEDEGSIQTIMGCTCLGNPADGRASVNAGVRGISLSYLMEQAGLLGGVNTVVFTSADGYEVALPLSYVKYRFSVIAYQINDEPLKDVLGSNNQLWLGSSSANNFARDVTSVTFEARQTPPPAPFTEEGDAYYGNLPNIAVEVGA